MTADLTLFLAVIGIFSSVLIALLRRQRTNVRRAWDAAEAQAADRRASDERFATVFHATPTAIMIVRLSDGKLVDVNYAFVELWGHTQEQALGRTSLQLNLWAEPAQLIEKLKGNRHSDTQELQIRRSSGETCEVLASVRLIQLDGSAHLLITATDVTERNRALELEHKAHHDTLTDLPNRLLLHARLREARERTAARGTPSAMLFVDLDRFKQINDTFGHNAGDELLRLAAARLSNRIRSTDTVARVGGDEFVILLDGLRNAREAESIAADLVQQMAAPYYLSRGREVQIGASVGIGYFGDAHSDDLLIEQADAALYAAKCAGRNTVRVFRPQGAVCDETGR